jgi:hypothetical protein
VLPSLAAFGFLSGVFLSGFGFGFSDIVV